jgi:antitoxin ParD1/3/4
MRINIVIHDQLMAAAMQAGDFKTKKDAVEEGLRLLVRRKVYAGIRALRGKLVWDDSDEGWDKVAQERAAKEQAAKTPSHRASKAATRKRTTA